jgi:four helix bundle protein
MIHSKLDVWKMSMELTKEIYELTKKFPGTEKYLLTNQIRRASVSIPSNIAEGAGRLSDKEFIRFLYIAMGSLAELETQLLLASKLEYISKPKEILSTLYDIRKMLSGLIKYLNQKS